VILSIALSISPGVCADAIALELIRYRGADHCRGNVEVILVRWSYWGFLLLSLPLHLPSHFLALLRALGSTSLEVRD